MRLQFFRSSIVALPVFHLIAALKSVRSKFYADSFLERDTTEFPAAFYRLYFGIYWCRLKPIHHYRISPVLFQPILLFFSE